MKKREFGDVKKQDHTISSSSDDEYENCKRNKSNEVEAKSSRSSNNDAIGTEYSPKKECPYGKQCYSQNPEHLKQYRHSDQLQSKFTNKSRSPMDQGQTTRENPFGFYLNKVHGIPSQFNNENLALGIQDILSAKHGKLRQSAQFNFVIDVDWMMKQYPPEFRKLPILIVHGEQRNSKKALEKSGAPFPNVTFCQAKLPIPFGTHHTKMMLLLYEEGLRIAITTSNLVAGDWHEKSQAMWVSNIFPRLQEAPGSTSETNFKADLIQYLEAYECPELSFWINSIKQHDLSTAKVVLVGSVPGRHIGSKKISFGHLKLRKVLSKFVDDPGEAWPVIAQFSSIGSLGESENNWLCSELLNSLAASKKTRLPAKSSFYLIYPTVENVRLSLEGYPAGVSLPYSYKVEQKQKYLQRFFCQWHAPKTGRTEASPHIKTYMKVDPDFKALSWFLVTSANLSRAAWGSLEKKQEQLMIRSYELGVLFLPKFFVSETTFSIDPKNSNYFPVPYDLPPKRYSSTDEPWTFDAPHISAPDRNGMKWCPS